MVILKFEIVFVDYCGVNFGIVVNSVMFVLYIVCFVLGVSEGDRVWIFLNLFVVLLNCVFYCGVKVDFVDIDFYIGNMCVDVLWNKFVLVEFINVLLKVIIFVYFVG